ncbi:CRAL-TRIO domain-containing protein [Phlyctochytrium arcticum]|nr:CRAL-TRIO domain-containing protein [Phlyctochytrium arcticum]
MTASDPGHIDNLTPDQEETLYAFYAALRSAINRSEDPSPAELEDELWFACGYDRPDQLLLRFLRARKWDIQKAVLMTIMTLRWRREFGVRELITDGEEALDPRELNSNKSYFYGQDKEGRPCCYCHAQLHDKNNVDKEKGKLFTVLLLETGRLLLKPPQEMATIIFDMSNFGLKNMDYEYLKFLLTCMQDFYPESLGCALVVNAPWVFNGCWAVIRPWLDPVVASKVHFVKSNELDKYIDAKNLPEKLGGSAPDFKFVAATPLEIEEDNKRTGDGVEKEAALKEFRNAYLRFDEITEKLGSGDATQAGPRKDAEAQLRKAYRNVDYHTRAKTIYHRLGVTKDLQEVKN